MSNNAVITIVLLVMLLLLTTAPFSILSVLMAVALLSAVLWTGWTLIQAALTGNPPKDTP